ncbi:hypothetical protein RCL1_008516 [Eukaryota sp. TZLM3-RCL]
MVSKEGVVLVSGPRGSGKKWALMHCFKEMDNVFYCSAFDWKLGANLSLLSSSINVNFKYRISGWLDNYSKGGRKLFDFKSPPIVIINNAAHLTTEERTYFMNNQSLIQEHKVRVFIVSDNNALIALTHQQIASYLDSIEKVVIDFPSRSQLNEFIQVKLNNKNCGVLHNILPSLELIGSFSGDEGIENRINSKILTFDIIRHPFEPQYKFHGKQEVVATVLNRCLNMVDHATLRITYAGGPSPWSTPEEEEVKNELILKNLLASWDTCVGFACPLARLAAIETVKRVIANRKPHSIPDV